MKEDRANAPIYCGSRLVVSPKTVVLFIDCLASPCESRVSKSDPVLVDVHNAMTAYTLLMLLFATGHRAVKDPFFSRDGFDVDRAECLIEDKVVSAWHRVRLAWLPDIAVNQLRHYFSHLDALSRRLGRTDKDLARDVLAITRPEYPRPSPLFFFLEPDGAALKRISVTPSTLPLKLPDSWSLPLNANRHILATGLRELGCPAELVEVQLGHIEGGIAPFGAYSVRSPQQVGATLRLYLNQYMGIQGWREIEGLRPAKGFRLPKINRRLLSNQVMGPVRREVARQVRWRAESNTVAKLLGEPPVAGLAREISDDEVKALEDKLLASDLAPSRKLLRLALFRRHLVRLRRAGVKVRIPGRLAVVREERSPFERDILLAAWRAERARERFLDYLEGRSLTTTEPERRLAEIVISAVLFGALLAKELQAQIPDRVVRGFQYFGGTAFIDFSYCSAQPDAPIRRWLPDPVTLSLVTGFWRKTQGAISAPDPGRVLDQVHQVLDEIGVSYLKVHNRGSTHDEQALARALVSLAVLSTAYWSLRLPGVLREYAVTHDFSASLPLANWCRVLTGRKIAAGGVVGDSERRVPVADDANLAPKQGAVPDVANARAIWKRLKSALSLTHAGTNIPRIRKRVLEERLAGFVNESSVRESPAATVLCAWLLHLCRHGTPHQSDLRASTVVTYAATIGPLLLEFGGPLDVLTLSDSSFEDLYRRIVEASSRKDAEYVVSRLKEFHRFLSEAYAVPTVDWAEVFEGSQVAAVDAAIVTLTEYREALDTVLSDGRASERQRLLHAMILITAYRFGLRTGEIFRLTGGDVLRHGNEVVVYVRNSTYGFTKTDNGVRQVPLLGRLLPHEYDVIDRWLGHIDFYATDYSTAALLSEPNREKQVIERSAAVGRVVRALRDATGDPGIRLRHLRHTFGSRNFLYAYCEQVPTGILGRIYTAIADDDVPPADVRAKLLGDGGLSYRALYATSVAHGHGSPKVTLGSYIHILDVALHEEVCRDGAALSISALSYALGTTSGNVRQIQSRQRRGLKAETSLSHHFLAHLFSQDFPSGLIDNASARETAPDPGAKPTRLKPVDVDRFLSVVGLRGSVDGVAERFLVSESFMRQLLIVASRLQEKTRFTDFGLPVYLPEDRWVPGATTRDPGLDKEAARARAFLAGIEEDSGTLESLRLLCAAWASAYRDPAKELLFSRRSTLQQFLAASRSLGVSLGSFDAFIPIEKGREREQLWVSVREELTQQGLRVSDRNRLPSARPGEGANRVGLILRANTSHGLGYQRTLNRVIFVLSCFLQQDAAPVPGPAAPA